MLMLALLVGGGCSTRDPLAPQASPDNRFVLTPSFHEGVLIRLTVTDRRTGRMLDDVKTRDSNSMKWVTGWANNTSYLFWGADSGTDWVRDIGGTSVIESSAQGPACERLEQLFESKYGQRRTNCLHWK
jgi:hypothetical protein